MMEVRPFRGLRPIPERAGDVACPPYDVLDTEEARQRIQDNPLSFLRVIKPEADVDPSINPVDPRVYARGAQNFMEFMEKGLLIRDKSPCFYIYNLQMGDHCQTGLVAITRVDDVVANRIKRHEFTRPDKEIDRTRLIDSLNAQTGPAFLTFRNRSAIGRLFHEITRGTPVADFVGDYEVRHTLFRTDDPAVLRNIQEAFSEIDSLYIADGHHRTAAAVRVRDLRREKNPKHTGEEPYNFFLSVIFPDNELRILPYNRAVRDLGGRRSEDFLAEVGRLFDTSPTETKTKAFQPSSPRTFGMYMEKTWYRLVVRDEEKTALDPVESLDVSILQNRLLGPILGIADPRTDKRIDFIGGIRGSEELQRLVDGGKHAVAFSLFPTRIDQLLAVADAGKVMPPKSTWFEPKLRSGLVIHPLD